MNCVAHPAHLLLGRSGDIRLGTALTGLPKRLTTGLPELDATIGGGLPRGRISELTGPRSAGCTGLAGTIAAGATAAGELVAWIDPTDALDPETIAATGLTLLRMLWVRPRDVTDAFRATDILLAAGGFGLVVLDVTDHSPHRPTPWTRLARTAERTDTALLVLGAHHRVGATCALALELHTRYACWSRRSDTSVLLDGVTSRLAVVRNRHGPPGDEVELRQACA
jgi:hypothetical protein